MDTVKNRFADSVRKKPLIALALSSAISFWAWFFLSEYWVTDKLHTVLKWVTWEEVKKRSIKDVYNGKPEGINLVTLEEIRNTPEYKDAYEQIVSIAMDMPDEFWKVLRRMKKDSFTTEKISDLKMFTTRKDKKDLLNWLKTPGWLGFVNWDYSTMEDYIIERAFEISRYQEVRGTSQYMQAYKNLVEVDMDMPDDMWNNIRHMPNKFFSKDSVSGWLLNAANTPRDRDDLVYWLDTSDWIEFTSWDYKHLENYLVKKAWLTLDK